MQRGRKPTVPDGGSCRPGGGGGGGSSGSGGDGGGRGGGSGDGSGKGGKGCKGGASAVNANAQNNGKGGERRAPLPRGSGALNCGSAPRGRGMTYTKPAADPNATPDIGTRTGGNGSFAAACGDVFGRFLGEEKTEFPSTWEAMP